MRLIDADALEQILRKRSDDLMDDGEPILSGAALGAVCFVLEAPTIEATIVVQGQWTRPFIDQSAVQCSVCESAYSTLGNTPYCPECGAKMEVK